LFWCALDEFNRQYEKRRRLNKALHNRVDGKKTPGYVARVAQNEVTKRLDTEIVELSTSRQETGVRLSTKEGISWEG
jgi:hypothetical protein